MEPQKIIHFLQTAVKNLEQAPQECKPQRIGDAGKLERAIQEKRIVDSPEEDLKSCLRFCFTLVGLRSKNFPDELEKVFLMNFVREHYGGHTAAEIRLAFEMAVTGKLDIDPVCYENFSPVYFAGVMNAFRTWASEQVRMIEKTKPVEKVYTPEELLDIKIGYCFYLYNQINKLPCTYERLKR